MIDNQKTDQSKNIISALLALILIAQIYTFYSTTNFFLENGYLPSPFFYDKTDTFMDLFHSIFWADNEGRYTEWRSIYPPLNFILLSGIKLLFLGSQDFTDAFSLRESGLEIEIFFLIIYLTFPLMVLKTAIWRNFSFLDKGLLYLIFILSSPMLFALERGNIVIVTLILLALAISHSGLYRCIFIALLINIKPYFVVLTLLFLVKNKLPEFLFCLGVAGVVFVATGMLVDSNFLLLFENILNFSSVDNLFSFSSLIDMPSSISVFSAILSSDAFQNSSLLAFLPDPKILSSVIELAKWTIIIVTLVILFKATEKVSEMQVMALLVVIISNLGTSVGGYTLILYFTLIPIFWIMRFKWVYLGILALIYTSASVFLPWVGSSGVQYSYLSDTFVVVDRLLDASSLIKPILNISLLFLLSYEMASKKLQLEPKVQSVTNHSY